MEEPPQENCRELGELDELRARAQALAVKREQGSCFRRRVVRLMVSADTWPPCFLSLRE